MSTSSTSSYRSWKEELEAKIVSLRNYNLSGQIVFEDTISKARGGYCDVYVGRWTRQGRVVYRVAIKNLRVHILQDRDFVKVWTD